MEGWRTNRTVGERRRMFAGEGTCWEKNLNVWERTELLAKKGHYWGANGLVANKVERWTTNTNAKHATDCRDTNGRVGERN